MSFPWKNKHILSVDDFTPDALGDIVRVSNEMRDLVLSNGGDERLKHKILATVFFEPSTRTQCSFQSAMMRLGGQTLSINASTSSAKKGETIQDTIRCLECYSDALVMRHPERGSVAFVADYLKIPILNAGDGDGEHPTQALLDYFTIIDETRELNLDELNLTLVGDLKYGRTVHSLARLLAKSNLKVRLNYISPAALAMPDYVKEKVTEKRNDIVQFESEDLMSVINETDILYVTRIQKERFPSEYEYDKYQGCYIINKDMLSKHAKPSLRVLHPLPRVGEIAEDVDSDPIRAAYFRQMKNGMYVRMALLSLVLGTSK